MKYKHYNQLARIYRDLGDDINATLYYCKGIIEDIEDENYFAAGFYLNELNKAQLKRQFFKKSLEIALEKNQLDKIIKCHFWLGNQEELQKIADQLILNKNYETLDPIDKMFLLLGLNKIEEATTIFDEIDKNLEVVYGECGIYYIFDIDKKEELDKKMKKNS